MDSQQITIAQHCLNAAYDDTMSFPASVGSLIEAGFDSYLVDYRSNTRTYYLPNGESLVLNNPHEEGAVAAEFDLAGIVATIKWAQLNPPDYTYIDFNQRVTGYGCAGYLVSFIGRRVLYFGRTAEIHVEHFPQ